MKKVAIVVCALALVGGIMSVKYGAPAPYVKASPEINTGNPILTSEDVRGIIREELEVIQREENDQLIERSHKAMHQWMNK